MRCLTLLPKRSEETLWSGNGHGFCGTHLASAPGAGATGHPASA